MVPDFDKHDLQAFLHQVHQICARRLGIKHSEFKSANELYGDMKFSNPVVTEKLITFTTAYQAWFDAQKAVLGTGNGVDFSSDKGVNLQEAMSARDSTRQELIEELAKLPQWSNVA